MTEQFFGTQELYQVVLKSNTHFDIGKRHIEPGEPVLYFDNIKISNLNTPTRPIFARGGWSNLPRVIWENRGETTFTLDEGVITSTGMSILFSSAMEENDGIEEKILVPHREGPFLLDSEGRHRLAHIPDEDSKVFCFEYDKKAIQKKICNYTIQYVDKHISDGVVKQYAYIKMDEEKSKQYILDYYFKYGNTSLLYVIDHERMKGTFSLEAKFYTRDENEGEEVTNILTMPKVRVMSDINLRLGEKVSPTTSVFEMIAMPVRAKESDNLVMKIVRLSEDLDER